MLTTGCARAGCTPCASLFLGHRYIMHAREPPMHESASGEARVCVPCDLLSIYTSMLVLIVIPPLRRLINDIIALN